MSLRRRARAAFVPKSAARQMAELERALELGRRVGLSDDDTSEVVQAWRRHFAETMVDGSTAASWSTIRNAIRRRREGESWEPTATG